MNDLLPPFLFIIIPSLLGLGYWATHDPSTIRSLSAYLLDQVHTLNAWAKAQEARQRVYGKAIAKHRPPATHPVRPVKVGAV